MFQFQEIAMQLRTIINSWNRDWFEKMTPEQNAINKLVAQLDEVAVRYECIWGVYKLESLATGTLADKVQSQVDKLNDAISECDVAKVRDLVAGTIRMYEVLERNAVQLGHKPTTPDYWEINIGSKIYCVVKSVSDARSLHRPDGDKGICIITLEELCKLHEGRFNDFMGTAQKSKDGVKLTVADIDWRKGDGLPTEW